MKNIILFAMSKLGSLTSRDWTIDLSDNRHIRLFKKKQSNEKRITVKDCISQLEPVVRMVMENVNDGSFKLIMMCSNLANNDVRMDDDRKLQAVPFLFERLKLKGLVDDDVIPEHEPLVFKDVNQQLTAEEFSLPAKSGPCEVYKINAEFDSILGIEMAVNEICEDYRKEKCRLFIAGNGGLRENFLNITAISLLLKYKGIQVDGLWSTETGKDSRIIDCGNVYGMFEYVSAMNEFMKFGSAESLSEYFKAKLGMKENDPVLVAMNRIHYGINYCNVDVYENGLNRLKKAIKKGETKDDSIRNVPQFRMFEGDLVADYGNLFEHDEYWYTELIERCFQKGQLQQALTFNEAKICDDFFNSGIIYFDEKSLVFREPGAKRVKRYENIYLFVRFIENSLGDTDPIHKTLLAYMQAFYAVKGDVKSLVEYATSENSRIAFMTFLNTIDTADEEELKNLLKPYLPADIKTQELFETADPISRIKRPMNFCRFAPIRESSQELKLKTVFSNNKIGRNYKTLAAVMIYLFMILKKTRNTWNHGNENEQPDIEHLKTLILMYVECMKKLLTKAQELTRNVNLPNADKFRRQYESVAQVPCEEIVMLKRSVQ